ncbi:3-carboxy-cis,cis-muconate cycloisomerase, partial [Pseudomonas aeruginosa]
MSDVPANQLFDAYFTAAPMRAVFSDRGRLQGMLDFEAALARAEARTGVVPATAVAPIEAACRAELYDPLALAEAVATAGNSAIPLVKALGRQVAGGGAAGPRDGARGAPPPGAQGSGQGVEQRRGGGVGEQGVET